MFLIIFSLALIILNIICFIKKKYLYLFIPCMLFLPEYYGIEFNSSLPLLTVTRMMFIVFYVYAFINKRRTFVINKDNLRSISLPYKLLIGYFALRIISNLYYVTTYGQAVKTIFLLIFEQAFLLIAIYMLAPTKEELFTLLKMVIYTAAAFYIIGILESLTYIRIFDSLNIVSRNMLNQYFIRLGLLRATTTFGMPINYGNMCLFTLPFIMFLYEETRQKRYLFIAFLNILAMIHSGSRADFIFYVFILAIYFIFVTIGKKRKLLCLKNYFCVAILLALTTLSLSIYSTNYQYFYVGTVKSVLNEVGFEFDLSEGAPEGTEGFGENNNYGSGSRIAQFSGMKYTLKTSPIFGLGSKAQTRGDVQYFSRGHWHPSKTYDVGYVEIFCDEGIIGFTGYLFMILALFIIIFKKRKNYTGKYMALITSSYFLGMLSTANMPAFLMLILIISIAFF